MLAVKITVAVVAALVIYVVVAGMIRSFNADVEPEPEPGELHPVDYRYRCVVCGAEVTMTAAPTEDVPAPPRHCREDMALVVEADGP
jgi:hypothetical protein